MPLDKECCRSGHEFESELDRLRDRVRDIERVFDALATTINACIPGGTATSTLRILLEKGTTKNRG